MNQIEVSIIHAFSRNQTGGNPAGVVFNADGLSAVQKQTVARKLGLPETAFVSASRAADFRLEFFTPLRQIAHCGHATVAAFSLMRQLGRIGADESSKETIDGVRRIRFAEDRAFMEQTEPHITILEERLAHVLDALRIDIFELRAGLRPLVVNTGNAFLIVPMRDEAALAALRPDMAAVAAISAKHQLVGVYAYAIPADDGFDATARMFAPHYGIEEEAATGMAAGPLAAYLYEIENRARHAFRIEQGRFMTPASPSAIDVTLQLQQRKIAGLFAGGEAYRAATRLVTLD